MEPSPQPPAAPPPSPLVARADRVFTELCPYPGPGLRNHCHRLLRLATMLLDRAGHALAPELAHALVMVHDLGLLSDRDEGPTYMHRSRALFWRVFGDLPLPLPARGREQVDEILLLNHRVFRAPNSSDVTECFRRAVWIEHSRGLRTFGLPREQVRAVFRDLPRADFDAVLWDFTRRVLAHEPATLVRGIFF